MSGIKRHLAVDINGLPMAVHVTTANVSERDGANALLALNKSQFDLVQRVMADGGYTGNNFAQSVQAMINAEVIIAKQSDLRRGQVTPQRWVIERSFSWLGKYRRLWRNCERKLNTSKMMISLKRVQQLMRRANLRSIIVKKYRPQSSQGPVENRKNVLAQDFTTTKINQKWVADITYIHTIKEGWCYLASVMDLCTRKIIGYSFSRSMTTELALKALDNACVNQNPEPGLILHTDLGSQYTSHEFEKAIQEKQIVHSFSKKGCPYDNACIESFHATLKKEEIHQTTYHDFNEARRALFQYIEGWYNRSRIHSCLDYLTPQEAEDKFLKVA